MSSTEMKPQRSTAKRRRGRGRSKDTNHNTSKVLSVAAILAIIQCVRQTHGSLFVSALSGNFLPRSCTGQERGPFLLHTASCSVPCRRRVPFHLILQQDLTPCTRPLGQTRLASTAVNVPESSEPSNPATAGEDIDPDGAGSTSVQPINGEAKVSLVNDTTTTANGATSAKGNSNTGATVSPYDDDSNTPIWELPPRTDDVPHPTANGGFSHTKASKAKISAANKGKTPWNKGKRRSEETRARIAAGVRAKNRERFLKKLQDMGLSEEEYEQQRKEERRKKDAERRARRTAKGGYRPTEETKQKISAILKAKWANGELKKTPVHPDKVRRGFTHSAETRAKISQSLKKRWAEDPEYRATMVKKSSVKNSAKDVKERISATLKRKWEDPEFRAHMLEKIANRKSPENAFGQTHRDRISRAMKAKWQDAEYRKKALDAMAKRRLEMGIVAKPKRKKKAKKVEVKQNEFKSGVRQAQPVQVRKKKKKAEKRVVKKREGKVVASKARTRTKPKTTRKRLVRGEKKEPDGSISRLREERRDLYDLLYADEDESPSTSETDSTKGIKTAFSIGDEDLDDFDPYGLEDF